MPLWTRHLPLCAVFAMLLVAGGCSERSPMQPEDFPANSISPMWADSATTIGLNASLTAQAPPGVCSIDHSTPGEIHGCDLAVPQVMPSSPWLYQQGSRDPIYEPPYTDPIRIVFPEEVWGIDVIGQGVLKCGSTSFGTLTGYRNGVQVAQVANYLPDTADCGDDDVSGHGIRGTLPPGVIVDEIVIVGVDPWTFDVFGSTGRAALGYTVLFSRAELRVSCIPSPVDRGQEVTCSVVLPEGAPPTTISEWKFTSPDLSAPIVEQTSDTIWKGIAATGGEVSIAATLGGDPISGRGNIVVQARDWSADTVRYQVVEKAQTGVLPEKPTRVGELGATANHGGIFPMLEHYKQITSGPQKGVWYWLHTPAQGESWIYINHTALATNSAFYLRQPTNVTKPGSCTQADVVPFLTPLEAHEGLNVEPGSHAGVFRQKLNELVPKATESVVSLGAAQDLDSTTTAQTADEFNQATIYAKDSINGGTVPPVPYCNFKFF